MTKHEQSRRFADKSTKTGREFFETAAWEAEEVTKGAKQNSSSVCTMRELNITLINMARAKADAAFDLAHEIASAQAPSNLVAIWSTHASRQFEMMTNQTRKLTDLGQKLASQNGKTLTRSFTRGDYKC